MTVGTKSTSIPSAASDYLARLWARREFAWYMAMGNLRSRNASTALGLFWWVLNPLLMGAVYFVVFGIILNVGDSRDIAHLLSGIFVFYFTSTVISTGANSIIQNTRMLVNLQFPRLIMPITALLETAVGFLVSIPVFYLIVGPTQGVWPTWTLLLLFPVAFAIQCAFNLGLASLTARVTVPFRDVTNLIPHLNRIWLYLSPILFTAEAYEQLPDGAETIANLNPMVPILAVYRGALLGTDVTGADIALASAWGFGLAVISVIVFVRYEGKIARYL